MSQAAPVLVGLSNAPDTSVTEYLILLEFNWNAGSASQKYRSWYGNRVDEQCVVKEWYDSP